MVAAAQPDLGMQGCGELGKDVHPQTPRSGAHLPNSPRWATGVWKRTRAAARPVFPPRDRANFNHRLWFQVDE